MVPDLDAQNFPWLTFSDHFKGAAANLAISGETLRRDAGVDEQFKALAAKRTLDGIGKFHPKLDSPKSAPRQSSFRIAAYDLLKLAKFTRPTGAKRPFASLVAVLGQGNARRFFVLAVVERQSPGSPEAITTATDREFSMF
jgi:hypothetical protein